MRYLIQKDNVLEQKSRRKFLYDVFHLWFINIGSVGSFYILEAFPFNREDNILMIYGHNYNVELLLKKFTKFLYESNIFIFSCAACFNEEYHIEGKQVYLCPQSEEKVWLLRGKEFGFDFDITETELALYNCKKIGAYEKLISAFEVENML